MLLQEKPTKYTKFFYVKLVVYKIKNRKEKDKRKTKQKKKKSATMLLEDSVFIALNSTSDRSFGSHFPQVPKDSARNANRSGR